MKKDGRVINLGGKTSIDVEPGVNEISYIYSYARQKDMLEVLFTFMSIFFVNNLLHPLGDRGFRDKD